MAFPLCIAKRQKAAPVVDRLLLNYLYKPRKWANQCQWFYKKADIPAHDITFIKCVTFMNTILQSDSANDQNESPNRCFVARNHSHATQGE
jgi:hypothetical protein